MSKYIFDIETDGLLSSVTRMWIIYVLDIETGEMRYWLEGDFGWVPVLQEARLLVGHNIISYDLAVLEKLFNFKPSKHTTLHDTLLMSQVLNYRRFGDDGHAMERWGQYLGQPKVEHEDWSQYSEAMRLRCEGDVLLNKRIYDVLLNELFSIGDRTPVIFVYMRAEHAVARWCARAELRGWPFDVERAVALFAEMEVELEAARAKIQPRLGMRTVAKDKLKGVVPAKSPKWTKQGFYDANTAKWFGIDPCSGFEGEERMVIGDYSRVEFKELDLDSVTDVKTFLFRVGWVPTEYNWKRDEQTGKMVQGSPKITEDSLEVLEGDGKLYCDFLTTKSRYGILKTWLENVDENGNLHGGCFTLGTPSMRARHSIIVNVPSADSAWGKQMRQLFICRKGWKLIGCDSASNQARGLAHYLKNPEFVDLLLNGDIHSYNANVLTNVLKSMGINHVVPRGVAKRILYAFLFGASGGKLWSYVFGIQDKTRGNKLKSGFLKAVPGFSELIEKLDNIFGATKKSGDGYIPGIGGNRIYVDSFHKLLVYLLQACEKATCSAAVMLTMERLEAAGIPYEPCIMMHDEEDFQVPEEFAEQAAQIGKEAFRDGPKLFGVEIMDGDAKIGNNWYDVH